VRGRGAIVDAKEISRVKGELREGNVNPSIRRITERGGARESPGAVGPVCVGDAKGSGAKDPRKGVRSE
jgi:hypothetical protein